MLYYGRKFSYWLTQALTWAGVQTFDSLVATTVNIDGGTLDGTTVGSTTPASGTFSPLKSKGPAAITTFAGTVSTSGSSTTITWSDAADAILAGYDATNPVLGTTIITGASKQASVTQYVVSWTNATACIVSSVCTLAAATELTSVQLPIATFVDSAGVVWGWMNAAGRVRFITGFDGFILTGTAGNSFSMELHDSATTSNWSIYGSRAGTKFYRIYDNDNNTEAFLIDSLGNVLLGNIFTAGTSAAKVLAIGTGIMPTALVADVVQMGVAEYNGGTGDVRLNIYGEATVARKTAIGSGTVSINGAVTSGGGFTRQLAEATSGAPSGATGSIAVNVPSGARLLGVQLRVDTAITSDNATKTWAATYVNTPTTAITSGQVFDANTKFNAIHPAYEITTGTVTITITAAAGLFTGGIVRGIVYFESVDLMSSL